VVRFLFAAAAVLLTTAVPVSAAWNQAKTRHFIIYSKQKPAELKAYAERLERFDAVKRMLVDAVDTHPSDR
jgi:hypothetical protein